MKRKQKTLFIWNESKRPREDDSDTVFDNIILKNEPQLQLMLAPAPNYRQSKPLPYELLMEIFKNVIQTSENPLGDLCNLARVCESWRQIVLQSPTLWSRIDLTNMPLTDRNLATLYGIFRVASPSIREHIKEVSFVGALAFKKSESPLIIESLITAPNVTSLSLRQLKVQSRHSLQTIVTRSLHKCRNLRSLSLTQSGVLFTNQKWFTDYLLKFGKQLEVLNLAMSFTSIPTQVIKVIGSDICPNLKVLDISTCDALVTHSIDAIQLAESMQNLEVLRVGNVSFKRVLAPPAEFKLKKLRELSMPIGKRDADRDDALFATLTFGTDKITALDLRGCMISSHALLEMPSYDVRELHIDDLCPIMRERYSCVISKWAHSLEILSLVRINSPETLKSCLKALHKNKYGNNSRIREIDLSSSDVEAEALGEFLKRTKSSLKSINLSACRSLPRGTKGEYCEKPSADSGAQELSLLRKKII